MTFLHEVSLVVLALFLASTALGQQDENDIFAELQLTLSADNPSWPSPGYVSGGEFLSMLAQAAVGVNALVVENASCTLLFRTVVVTIFGNPGNAEATAKTLVQQINFPTAAVQYVLTQGQIAGANYTSAPVPIPAMYHAPTDLDNTFLVALGAGGVVLMIAQFLYGLYHFRGFGFIAATKDERS